MIMLRLEPLKLYILLWFCEFIDNGTQILNYAQHIPGSSRHVPQPRKRNGTAMDSSRRETLSNFTQTWRSPPRQVNIVRDDVLYLQDDICQSRRHVKLKGTPSMYRGLAISSSPLSSFSFSFSLCLSFSCVQSGLRTRKAKRNSDKIT